MNDRSKRISKLLVSSTSRASYINAKLNVLIPSQIRALRLRRDNMTQKQLAALAEMAQPRISAMERPGATKFNLETLVRLASAFKVGLKVEFVRFSEMLEWENNFSQDQFDVAKIDNDLPFLRPAAVMEIASSPSAAQAKAMYVVQSRQPLNEEWNLTLIPQPAATAEVEAEADMFVPSSATLAQGMAVGIST